MRKKTTAGTYGPLLAIGITAALGGCATQEDAPLAQFNQPPVIEAIYGRDSVASPSPSFTLGDFPDVQLYANPNDPHYPNPLGETGAQNANDVSTLPASYGAIVVEFNIPLDGSKFGTQNDLGSYCSDGNPASTTNAIPFQILDVDDSNRALVGSICYDSSSPLYRYPALLFVLGAGTATDASATPFTCNAFNSASGDGNDAVFKPSHNYAVQFNTAAVVNENEQALTTPTDPGWTSGLFKFQTGGFDIMAAGFQNANNGYFSFITKPYAGYLKDCPANTIGCDPQTAPGKYEQPSDGTPFFINFAFAVDPAIGTADQNGNPITDGITATRSDGSSFDAAIVDAVYLGGDPRQIAILPGLTWEPGVSYTITIPSSVVAADETTTVTNAPSAPLTFTACAGADCTNLSGAGVLTNIGVTPTNGAIAQLPYGNNNGGYPNAVGDQPSWIVLDYSAPLNSTAALSTANITVTAVGGAAVAGTLQFTAGSNNQQVNFVPNSALASSTTYTVSANNLTVDASVPTLGGQAFPAFTSQFTTATVRTTSLLAEAGFANAAGAGLPFATLVAPTQQTPLDGLLTTFSRPVTGVNNTNVTVQEINSDGTAGAVLPSNIVDVAYQNAIGQGFFGSIGVTYGGSGGYVLKCGTGAKQPDGSTTVNVGQTYDVLFGTAIADSDETPAVNLSRQGCTTGNCQDLRQFTMTPFANVPDALGNAISYTPASGNVADTFTISFNASLDSATVNPLLAAVSSPSGGFITLTDGVTNMPVQLTCPALTDDTFMTITCTAPTLAANHPYTATLVVPSTSPLPIAAQATIPTFSGVDPTTGPIPSTEVVPADQTTCAFSGALLSSYVTPCPPTSSRTPAHKSVAHKLKLPGTLAMK